MSLKFHKPDIKESIEKPIPLENKGFPYAQLADSRRFEELIYSIYSHEIQRGTWKEIYDDIDLMQGVREKGRDCVLYSKGKTTGIIQCKYSKNNARINKTDCLNEILKFILHSIVDNRLITDIKNFTYYFAVSYGFTENALDLITTFNSAVLEEPDLFKSLSKIIDENKGDLQNLSLTDNKAKIEYLLSNLKLKKILPQDLDLLLAQDFNSNIASLFFEIRSIVDTTVVKEGFKLLEDEFRKHNSYQEKSEIPVNKIIEKFEIASFSLSEYQNEIENIPNSHLERKETEQLFNWITTPLKPNEKPIAVLAGNAGYGKTVILKDLYQNLKYKGIPILGLKADRIYATSIEDLEKNKIQLYDGVDKIINQLLTKYEQVIFIIDQLDALSQSLSIKREYLDTYNILIQKLLKCKNIRVIVSVRNYDLNYDTSFSYYKEQKTFQVTKIEDKQLKSVLSKISVNAGKLPKKLIDLIKIPINLNIFCQIYMKDLNLSSIATLYDLYNLYWKKNLIDKPIANNSVDSGRLIKTIYSIAQQMNVEQKICIGGGQIIAEFSKELEYLKSNDIVVERNMELQFFHQTFYDYVFAKKFIDEGRSISDLLSEYHQGLFVRSSLSMIMSFLRHNNIDDYLIELKKLIPSRKTRFHIKLLLINNLAFETNPSQKEKAFVEKQLLQHKKYKYIFLESIFSAGWLTYLKEGNKINDFLFLNQKEKIISSTFKLIKIKWQDKQFYNIDYRRNIVFQILIRHLPEERQNVLEILRNLPKFENSQQFIFRILYYLNEWDNPIAFELFEKYQEFAQKDKFDFYKILQDAIEYNFEWVLRMYKPELYSRIDNISSLNEKIDFDHQETELLKKVFEKNPEEAFWFYWELMKRLIHKTSSPKSGNDYCVDISFMFFSFNVRNNDNLYNYQGIMHKLIEEIRKQSIKNTKLFKKFIAQYVNSRNETICIVLIQALRANPSEHIETIFQFIDQYFKNRKSYYDGKLDYYVRRLLSSSYNFFSKPQQEQVNGYILKIKVEWENKIILIEDKKTYRKSFGYTKYKFLKAIPENLILKNNSLKKVYLELSRKGFAENFRDEEPNRIGMAQAVPPPLPQKAYVGMKTEDWEKTFLKYCDENSFWENGELLGSMLEHSRRFSKEVASRPEYFYEFIDKLIDEDKVQHDYIIKGLEGLKEGNFHASKLLNLVKRTIKLSLSRENTLYIIWLTDYFIKHENIDELLLDFLIYQALNNEDPSEDKLMGGISQGINSVRGAATDRICQATFNVDFHEKIFNALFLISKDKCACVRATIMRSLGYFLNIDKNKTLKLFLELVERNEEEVYEVSIWTVQYLSYHFFSQLGQYFRNAIQIEKLQKEIAVILAVRWLENKRGSKKLLKNVLKTGDKAFSRMTEVAIKNYSLSDKKLKRKCKYLYTRNLGSSSKEVAHSYSTEFLRLSPTKFEELYSLLSKYSNSRVARKSPHYFFEYIQKCGKEHPIKSLDLLIKHNNFKVQDGNSDGYRDKDALKAMLSCYNSLRNDSKVHRHYMKKSIRLFDTMLQNPKYRFSANSVLEMVDG